MKNFSEFNTEDYADNQKASLEELFDHLNHFIKYLQYDNINIDQFLPAGATLIKHDKILLTVQEFRKSTGAPHIKHQIFYNEGN
ncbi:3019_t:CDS:2, partial [Cetraspora pellucida]